MALLVGTALVKIAQFAELRMRIFVSEQATRLISKVVLEASGTALQAKASGARLEGTSTLIFSSIEVRDDRGKSLLRFGESTVVFSWASLLSESLQATLHTNSGGPLFLMIVADRRQLFSRGSLAIMILDARFKEFQLGGLADWWLQRTQNDEGRYPTSVVQPADSKMGLRANRELLPGSASIRSMKLSGVAKYVNATPLKATLGSGTLAIMPGQIHARPTLTMRDMNLDYGPFQVNLVQGALNMSAPVKIKTQGASVTVNYRGTFVPQDGHLGNHTFRIVPTVTSRAGAATLAALLTSFHCRDRGRDVRQVVDIQIFHGLARCIK